jgi:hypothetical protein
MPDGKAGKRGGPTGKRANGVGDKRFQKLTG